MEVTLVNPDIRREIKVTNELTWLNFLYDYPYRALSSILFSNNGPSAVEVGINYPDRPLTLPPKRFVTVNASEADVGFGEGIRIIYLKGFPGLLAEVLVMGKFYE